MRRRYETERAWPSPHKLSVRNGGRHQAVEKDQRRARKETNHWRDYPGKDLRIEVPKSIFLNFCQIIVPASLQANWKRECDTWCFFGLSTLDLKATRDAEVARILR